MIIRQPNDRRKTTLKGVTGFDRRRTTRRVLLDAAIDFVPVDVTEFGNIRKEYDTLSGLSRKGVR